MNLLFLTAHIMLSFILNCGKVDTVKSKRTVDTVISVKDIQKQKVAVDRLSAKYAKQKISPIIIYVKLYNKTKPVKVKNERWPENIEYTYNIVKDSSNRIVQILASPTSESGDWDITYTHYFNAQGKLIAFEKFTGFFNSGCAGNDGVAHETVCYYYNNAFKVISKSYKLTDANGKKLVKGKCDFPYDFKDYKTYPDADKCLAAYHIPICD